MEDMPAVFPFEGLKMIEDEQNMREEVVEGLEETDIRLPRKMERPVSVASQVSDVGALIRFLIDLINTFYCKHI